MQPTFLYVALVYFVLVFLWRRVVRTAPLPWRYALFFYALVLILLFKPMTQEYVNVPADYLARLYPWRAIPHDGRNRNPEINDVILQMVPWAHEVRESWKRGEIPLWNDTTGGGYPLLANGQSAAFSPFRIAMLPLSLGNSMTGEAALKLLLALTFAYLFARRHFGEAAAVVGAVSFGFSTFLVVWLHFPHASVVSLLPALFLALELVTERPTYRRSLFLIGVLVTLLYGGHPESVAHVVLISAAYELILLWRSQQRVRVLVTLVGCGAAALTLALPFLIPFAEALPRSQRFQWLSAGTVDIFRGDGEALVPFIHPEFYGLVKDENVWGAGVAELICGYSGVLAVVGWFAALARLLRRGRATTIERFAVFALPLLLAVALGTPVIADLFHKLPLFSLAANGRLRLAICWIGALLAAAAVERVGRRRSGVVFGVAAVAAAFFITVVLQKSSDAVRVHEALFTGIPRGVVLAVLLVASLRLIPRRAGVLMILAAVVFDLFSFAMQWNPVVEARELYPATPIVRKLQREAKSRVFRFAGTSGALFPNSASIYGLEDIRAHDPMANGRFIGTLRAFTGYSSDEYFGMLTKLDSPYIDLLNVRYAMVSPSESLKGRWVMTYRGRDGVLYRNPRVLPRFFAPEQLVVDPSQERRVQRLLQERDFAARGYAAELPSNDVAVVRSVTAPRRHVTVERIVKRGDDYSLVVNARSWSAICSSVAAYPGWRVTSNGQTIPTFVSNENFVSWLVPPGRAEYRVEYVPMSFVRSVEAALVALFTLMLLGYSSVRSRVNSLLRRAPRIGQFL